MDAIGVALGVRELFCRRRGPLLLVYLRVRVLAVFRELRDVENSDRDRCGAQRLRNDPHHAFTAVFSPVRWVLDRSRLVEAVPVRIASPFSTPAKWSPFSICLVRLLFLLLILTVASSSRGYSVN